MTSGSATITDETPDRSTGEADWAAFSAPLPHPGEILREDFMAPLGLSPSQVARRMGLKDRTRIERLIRSRTTVSPDTALRLGRVFGTTATFWMNLQAQHDLSRAALEAGAELSAIEPLVAAA